MKTTLRPLKAYEIFLFGWYAGIVVATTNAKARAQFALSDGRDGARNRWAGLRSCLLRNEEEAILAIEKHEDEGKYWRDTRAFARRQAECDTFNASWPVGTPVRVVNCCEADHWPEGVTFTRTPAWAVNENTAMVSLEGYAGGFYLKNVRPLIEPLDA